MKVPIPNDFKDEWICIRLVWPKSDLWLGLLMGMLTLFQRGRHWDEKTGSLTGIQSLAREIENRNYPFNFCLPDTACAATECGGITILGENEMGQVVTNVYTDNETGELVVEFGPCCVRRYPIAATLTEGQTEPDEGDTEPPEGDSNIACKKAYHMADSLTQFVGEAWDAYLPDSIGLYLWMKQMRASWGHLNISYWSYYKLYVGIGVVKLLDTVLWGAVWSDLDTAQLTCLYLPHLNGANYAVSWDEYNALQSAKNNVQNQVARAVINLAFTAVGKSGHEKWAIEAIEIDPGVSCECPGASDYDGVFKFTGEYDSDDSDELSVTAGNNGKYIDVGWEAPAGAWVDNTNIEFTMTGGDDIDQVKVRVVPLAGSEMPTEEWIESGSCPENDPDNWTFVNVGSDSGRTEDHVIIAGGYEREMEWGGLQNITLSFANFRKCGGSVSTDAKSYAMRIELIEVNDAPL